jgi:hypothetical protein
VKHQNIFSVFALIVVLASCAAEDPGNGGTVLTGGTGAAAGAGGAGTTGGGGEGTAGSSTAGATCEPKGQNLSCYCPDGSMVGTQLCDNSGKLGPCTGCPEVTGGSGEGGSGDQGGALCQELQGQLGCVASSYESEELPASILFVIDRSGSMLCNTPADGQTNEECDADANTKDTTKPTKWQITSDALIAVFDQLKLDTSTRAGLMFFSNNDSCGVNSDLTLGGVPVDSLTDAQISLLKNALSNVKPKGGTPLVGATILAYAHLHEEWGGDCGSPPCGAPGNRFVVLITDGADSCPDPTFTDAPCGSGGVSCTHYLLETEVRKAVGVNIRTFVIGAPGSDPARGFLSELAFQGGEGKNGGNCTHGDPDGTTGDCHFDMTASTDFAGDLALALNEISGSTVGCEFSVPDVPDADNPENVNVQYTPPDGSPVCIPQDNTAPCDGGANGWQFAKRPDGTLDTTKVVLCGEACNTVENIANVYVEVLLGCTAIKIE